MRTKAEEQYIAKDYWEKRLTEKWGLQGVGHTSFGLPYNQWLYRVRRHVFRRHLSALGLNCRTTKVLDIGSGTGFWLEEWQSHGVQSLTGLDITHIAVEKLREKFPKVQILRLDISDPEAPQKIPGRFDLISAFDVLFHITYETQFDSALSNVAELLSPGGYFIFSDNLVHAAPIRSGQEVDRTVGHITEALNRVGLQIRRRVPLFVLMNTPFDTSFRITRYLWLLCVSPVHFVPALGHLYGAALFPLELLLTKLLSESPSTEMVICQKLKGSENRVDDSGIDSSRVGNPDVGCASNPDRTS
jgi:SAM-dependent methyltransferase